MRKYKLMIKQHNVTGKKYLCVSSKPNWFEYKGSGVHWLRHLRKHGETFTTELLYESLDKTKFNSVCLEYSIEFSVVKSDEWLNILPEIGYPYDIEERNQKIKKYYSELSSNDDIKRRKAISEGKLKYHKNNKEKYRKIYEKNYEKLLEGQRKFFNDGERQKEYRERLSKIHKERIKNMSNEKKAIRNKNISDARKNMPEEAKEKRKQKIQAVYDSGKHDKFYEEMSKKRIGGGNPNAKPVRYRGKRYDSISLASRETNVPYHIVIREIKKINNEDYRYEN